jgi:Melibiase
MNRRTFLLLTSAVSMPLGRRTRTRRHRSARRLHFELDGRRRWSLWYLSEREPVPLISDAVLGAWVAEEFIALSDLEYSAAGSERPSGGEAVLLRGRAAGVTLEARFLTRRDAIAPSATVSLTIYPDRRLPRIAGVRFFERPLSEILPGGGPLTALTETAAAGGGPRIVTVPPSEGHRPAPTSYGALGLSRDGRGLALAFDAADPGLGMARVADERLEAASAWTPARALAPAGDTARLHLCYDPAGDGLVALRGLFAPASPVDRARFAAAVIPAGWSSRGLPAASLTEAAVVAHAELCARRFGPRFCHVIFVGDGYQRALGDWDTNERFARGHRWLTDQLHARGFQAALWLAPFAVAERSEVFAAHGEWLLPAADRGDCVFTLDGAHPGARAWLSGLARRAVRDWGYDGLELELPAFPPPRGEATGSAHYGGATDAEAYRRGLAALRDGAGSEAFLLGVDAPLEHSRGLVNGMRIAPDASDTGVDRAARATALRSGYHRGAWLNDPGRLLVGPPLPGPEAELWTSIVAVSGALTILTEDVAELPPERCAIAARALPVARQAGRPIAPPPDEATVAPALVAQGTIYPIAGPWKLRTGDDAGYAARPYDETAWETVPVPGTWSEAGHQEYAGYAWYRVRLPLPPRPPQSDGGGAEPAHLELGKIAERDETFVNGVKVGETAGWDLFRRYAVPADLLDWGTDNVLALRVWGRAGDPGGGLWSVRRERPARVWITEGAPSWWTVVLANWEDTPAESAVPLATLGLAAARYHAYDVWRGVPLPEVTETVRATLAPRSGATIALRPAARHPQVVGTTRHVVQGTLDLAGEAWDWATRVLRGRAIHRNGRAYAATLAVPPTLRAARADARRAAGGQTVPCTLRALESGHVVLEWPAGGDEGDVDWTVTFRPARAGRGERGTRG